MAHLHPAADVRKAGDTIPTNVKGSSTTMSKKLETALSRTTHKSPQPKPSSALLAAAHGTTPEEPAKPRLADDVAKMMGMLEGITTSIAITSQEGRTHGDDLQRKVVVCEQHLEAVLESVHKKSEAQHESIAAVGSSMQGGFATLADTLATMSGTGTSHSAALGDLATSFASSMKLVEDLIEKLSVEHKQGLDFVEKHVTSSADSMSSGIVSAVKADVQAGAQSVKDDVAGVRALLEGMIKDKETEQAAAFSAEIAQLKDTHAAAVAQLVEEHNAKVLSLETQLKTMQDERDGMASALGELKEDFSAAMADHSTAVQAKEERIAQCVEQNELLAKDLHTVKTERDELLEVAESLRSEVAAAHEAYAGAKEELDSEAECRADANARSDALSVELEESKKEASDLWGMLSEMEEQIFNQNTRIAELERVKDELSDRSSQDKVKERAAPEKMCSPRSRLSSAQTTQQKRRTLADARLQKKVAFTSPQSAASRPHSAHSETIAAPQILAELEELSESMKEKRNR